MDELISELKAKREALGLTIEDLFQRTRINAGFLEALEAGNFEVLPDAYVKLFLKKYAQEVKLDGDEIVRRFEQLQWKETAATETSHQRDRGDGLPGWVIGAGAAVAISVVTVLVVSQSDKDTASAPPRPQDHLVSRVRTEPVPQQSLETPPPQVVTTPPTEASPPALQPEMTQEPEDQAESTAGDPAPTQAPPEPDPESQPSDSPSTPLESTPAPDTPPIVEVQPTESTELDVESEEETIDENERVVSAYSLSLRQDLSASDKRLTLSAVGLVPTEVTVTSDGEPVFNGLVDAGRRIAWEARDRFSIEIQKGSDIRLQFQDETLPAVGVEGRQVRLYISRFSIWVEEIELPDQVGSSASP